MGDRFTFLALGQVIGSETRESLDESHMRRLMAGGADIDDLATLLAE